MAKLRNVWPLFKICTGCRVEKSVREFYFDKQRSYFFSKCKKCTMAATDKDRKRTGSRERWQRYGFKSDLRVRYGITPEEYDRLLRDQNGCCAICSDPPNKRRLHVDHDHVTGQVRQLLCSNCNTALGKFDSDPDLLLKARDYLIKWRSEYQKAKQQNGK